MGHNLIFNNAQEAFEFYFDEIKRRGVMHSGAKAIFNQGFTILNPMENEINTPWRKWSKGYAVDEWAWYMTADNRISKFEEIRKHKGVPPIWRDHANKEGEVMSNYGYQWARGEQIDYVVKELNRANDSRRAVLTMYDGKENVEYTNDTPCTLSAQFQIVDGKLNMTIMMRSNDLVYGFCNDQYCFSKLQELIAEKVGVPIGYYYHFASNLHLYPQHLNLKHEFKESISRRV